MVTSIIKRKGAGEQAPRIVPFDKEKITLAIFKAAQSVGGTDMSVAEDITNQIVDILNDKFGDAAPTVEQVQDIVEKVLIENGHAKTAKAYILYRENQAKARALGSELEAKFAEITNASALESDMKRENANIDGNTAMGSMLKYGSEGAKSFYLKYIMKPQFAKAHQDGLIHIHDMDFYPFTLTCCQIDLEKLFKGGFSTGHGFLREPNSIESYAALACIAIQSNQNDQHGGQSIPEFDYYMAPGVKKSFYKDYVSNMQKAFDVYLEGEDPTPIMDKMVTSFERPSLSNLDEYQAKEKILLLELTDEENVNLIQKFVKKYSVKEITKQTHQAMQALMHNLNTMHSRAGAQVPFSSLNYGTDTSAEGRLVMEQLLIATEEGLGHGETPIFPIQIFKVKEGKNYFPEDPNYDLFKLAIKVSAKRLFPNFSFLDSPYNLQYYKEGNPDTEVAYMGCRTRVIGNTYDPTREIVTGRGNLSFTTINLVRIGIENKNNLAGFYEELDKMMDLVISQLLHRLSLQGQKRVRNFPFLMGQGVWLDSDKLDPDDTLAEVVKHGTLSLGFIGLAECLKAMTGSHHGESDESYKIGYQIIKHMREKLDAESKATGLNWSLLATPAEGLSGRFTRIDKEKYGVIEGVTDRDYYTNSFHIPVYYPISAFNKIKKEAPFHALTNAGHISYIELDGDASKNLEAFEAVVRCMHDNQMGYAAINHPVDRDPVCGFNGIIDNECPNCGRKEGDGNPNFERIRRITGYLVGTTDRWNNGKKAEEHDRVKHGVSLPKSEK